MDRTGKIVVALAIIALVAWTIFNQREMEKVAAVRRAAAAEVEQKKAAEEAANPTPAKPAGPASSAAAAPAQPTAPEKREMLAGPSVEVSFTNLGGGIANIALLKHEAERDRRMVMNQFGTIPIGAVSEVAGEGTGEPFTSTVDDANGAITFARTDERQIETTKKFTVPRSTDLSADYVIQLDLGFSNKSDKPVTLPSYFLHLGSAAPVHQRDLPNYIGFKSAGGEFTDVTWFAGGWFHPERPIYTATRDNIAWAAVADQYFTTLASAVTTAQDAAAQTKQRGSSVWAKRFVIGDAEWKETNHSPEGNTAARYGIEGALGMPGFIIEPGQTVAQSFRIYSGPREYARLHTFPNGESEVLGFSDVRGLFGVLGPFIGFFSKVLLWAMNALHAALRSYALALIVLTLVIKTMLWPMQNRATQSMKRMQALQPKMAELKEKYSDDPTRMNTETLKLYKDYGVNPLSGCLPMFIQIPIFFGFYNMIGKAVELRNSRFLWIHDLSQPDTLFHFAGYPVNILPIIMAGTMLWQMSISPKSGDPAQQRMMMFMPLIFVLFCYNYASALALYWAVQNLFSVGQLYWTRNQAPPQLLKVAARKKR